MAALIRQFDWHTTPLGPPAQWPQSLKTAIRIMLTSRQPIWIGWGPDLLFFYNDPYKAIIGGKHPVALGRPTAEVWHELWPDIGPLLATAMAGTEGTFVEQKLLIMERNGYPEETYYTFSYSPVPDDHGGTGGIICANSDDTERVVAERQLNLLRELATSATNARSGVDASRLAVSALQVNAWDIPFALLYVGERGAETLGLRGSAGIVGDHPAAPQTLDVDDPLAAWPAGAAMRTGTPVRVDDPGSRFAVPLPRGAWQMAPRAAVVLPVQLSGESMPSGVLVVGLNPCRLLGDRYRAFLDLVVGQISQAISYANAYEEERRRAEALAEIDRAKTTFFSNISHEFRTPLTLMLGPLEEMLHRRDVPDDDRALAEIAHRNGQRLLKLVNALLDFSRIEAGRVQMYPQPTDLAAFTADLASLFRSAVESAGMRLEVDCPPLPAAVAVDREMWESVVLNLLSNAFKYTYTGAIAVKLEGLDSGEVTLCVSDTGIGIAAEEVPRLFERFHRVAGAVGRSIEGSGIGLAMVQELVRLHGGRIDVQSVPDKGSRFCVTLPREASLAEPATTPAATSARALAYVDAARRWVPGADDVPAPQTIEDMAGAEAADVRGRLLVADDNVDLRNYMHRILQSAGHQVHVAADGQEALDMARRIAPDLIVSDVMMPRLDGFGLLRGVRDDAALRQTPVLLLSARAGEEARVGGLASGADDYLIKPFNARELLARVASNLRLSQLRRQAQRELQNMNDSLERRVAESVADRDRLWELSDDLLMVIGADGMLERVSPSWQRVLGHAADVVIGRSCMVLVHPEDLVAVTEQMIALQQEGVSVRYECRMLCADGAECWMAWTLAIDPANGRIHGVGRDVTGDKAAAQALRHADEALRMAQKMEAIGKLTGGVAHDFNNLLQVIGGNLHLLSGDVAGDDRSETRVRNALAGVARGAKLASQLLAFGRRQPLAPKVVNLGRFVRGLDDMLRRALGDGVEIETVIGAGLWNTLIDPFQVENALLNLAINARDAMNGHGRLTVEAGNASIDDVYARRNADVAPGQYVMLAVSDTGAGMPPEIQEQVFEPFFTTKPEGQGTGLGLSMVYGFVRQSGGHVKIYSEVGVGTTVRLYLPRADEPEDLEVEIDDGPASGGTETVLVVEDDENVRATVVEMLSGLGYRVLKARDATSALAIVESGVPIDLLFSDVVMPGPLRSTEMARKVRQRLPGIAVLFTSGYTDNAVMHTGRLDAGIELLSKPYTHEALARKVRQMLVSGGARLEPADAAPVLAMDGVPAVAAMDGMAIGRPRHQRVVFVEDDDLLRASTAELMRTLGIDVIEARNDAEAMVALGGDGIDLLLTDVGLGGVSGVDLAIDACRLRPALRVIFVSGYEVVLTPAQRDALPNAVMLRKPYALTDFINLLQSRPEGG
ncbi:two-component system sensor histidine kinase/response regulator [Cupriavidus pauculus]|uniref:histidine kinase n=2 Tax=Cupriavidus pauculus TaxID=82633 RepID=A0A2N5C875_9BURK|nr:two-component system sensor histidine kinase/response regulator [Cupriavidus pauculus]